MGLIRGKTIAFILATLLASGCGGGGGGGGGGSGGAGDATPSDTSSDTGTNTGSSTGSSTGGENPPVTVATLQSIAITLPQSSLPKGTTAQLSATGSYSDGSTQTLADVTWSSSAPNVATVDGAGLVSGAEVGSAVITATTGEVSGTATLDVTAPVLVSMAVTPADFFLASGFDQQLTATGTYSDGSTQDLTGTVAWSSSDPALAAVSDSAGTKGLATFGKVGEVTFTATDATAQVSGSVTPPARHVMFVTSTTGTGDLASWTEAGGLTGLEAGDAVCQARATAAGLAGSFKAWLSSETDDAYCRIAGFSGKRADNCGQAALPTGAGPWIRTDGYPFSESLGLMAAANSMDSKTYTPPRYNESGVAEYDAAAAFTGTDAAGTAGGVVPCSNWTSTTTTAPKVGLMGATTPYWTAHAGNGCGVQDHLLCFQTGSGPALPAFASTGKKVFITSATGKGDLSTWAAAGSQSGVAAGDAICQTLAAVAGVPNAVNFKAWLSDSVTAAKDRFTTATEPYVRLDGVKVADDLASLVAGNLFTGINLTEKSTTLGGNGVWTGTAADGTAAAERCNDWTDGTSGVAGRYGAPYSATVKWMSYTNSACSYVAARLYCIED